MSVLLAPSLLAANFLELGKEVEMVNESQADLFHVDVMDGHFVPNLTFGFFIIRQIKAIAKKPLDVHLMISNPDRYLEEYKDAGADWLSVHYETCPHLHSSIQQIKKLGMKAGVVINPHNPVSLLSDIIPDADYVLLMSVNPGFGGQNFIESTYRRLQELKALKEKMNPQLLIEVDGGVDATNSGKLAKAGANVLVAGSAVFGADSPALAIREIKAAAE
ncbi:MAG: ribulose-phosphate 3-epimerase [Bacteroides sp.]|jgi:ribulose-phosphate 3-epimerase|nr:ribulose-phosphate 3-epimerase [Bacteroides sp.]